MQTRHQGIAQKSLLCVANFPSNTGYAWNFIEGLYAGVARRLHDSGVATWVAYPSLDGPPATLVDSPARHVEMAMRFGDVRAIAKMVRFVRANRVEVLYLSDRPTWHAAYWALRIFGGVRRIVVHDHTSGSRTAPGGVKRHLKRLSRQMPGFTADHIIAVSDYVARRQVEVNMIPRSRVSRVWNAVASSPRASDCVGEFRRRFGLDCERPVVMCYGRAVEVKGVQHLFVAFDRLLADLAPEARPSLVYFGDGPYLTRLRALREQLNHGDQIHMPGYVEHASRYVGAATVCVFPSTWEEAFGLGALEPMEQGVPVIASDVGGLPEVVAHGETGLLVPPGDPDALKDAMHALLSDPARRSEMGRRAQERVRAAFSLDRALDEITTIVADGVFTQEQEADCAGA